MISITYESISQCTAPVCGVFYRIDPKNQNIQAIKAMVMHRTHDGDFMRFTKK